MSMSMTMTASTCISFSNSTVFSVYFLLMCIRKWTNPSMIVKKTKYFITHRHEVCSQLLGNGSFLWQFIKSLLISIIVKLEKLVCIIILVCNQGFLGVCKVHGFTSVAVVFVYNGGKRFQSQFDVNLILFFDTLGR